MSTLTSLGGTSRVERLDWMEKHSGWLDTTVNDESKSPYATTYRGGRNR